MNWREGGSDFWPGEYSKTYVYAQKNHDDIMDGIRNGRVFVTLGDLISELYVTVWAGQQSAQIGSSVDVAKGEDLTVTIRFKDPDTLNAWKQNPQVTRIDLIMGEISGPVNKRNSDHNPTTKVIARFDESDWMVQRGYKELTYVIRKLEKPGYIRIRGTNSDELEPLEDAIGENPWDGLWFYSNPIFMDVKDSKRSALFESSIIILR